MASGMILDNGNIEDIKTEIEAINRFSVDFYAKNVALKTRVGNMMQKLDQIIEEESKNDTHLQVLMRNVSETELESTMNSMLEYKKNIETKSLQCSQVIEKNKSVIHEIAETIKKNKTAISSISEIVKSLEDSTSQLESKLIQ